MHLTIWSLVGTVGLQSFAFFFQLVDYIINKWCDMTFVIQVLLRSNCSTFADGKNQHQDTMDLNSATQSQPSRQEPTVVRDAKSLLNVQNSPQSTFISTVQKGRYCNLCCH